MPDFLKNLFSGLNDTFEKLEKGRKTQLIVLSVLLLVVIVVAAILLNQKAYTVLYSGMKPEDAGRVLGLLQDMNIDAKTRGADTILVEAASADQVRMELAAQGYPTSGFNYDIFAKASGLGTTDLEKKVYLQFQLQEHIRQTLIQMDKVEDAVVNISLPEDSLFVLDNNRKPATAAVMLRLGQDQKLAATEVRAIAELVSTSISGLKLEDVRIVDAMMHLYDINQDDDLGQATSQLELQDTIKNSLQQQVVHLLHPVFGEGNVLAEVHVRLNFDKETTESIVFNPPADGDEGLVVSLSEMTEHLQNMAEGGAAGIDSNGAAPQYPEMDGGAGTYDRVSRDVTMQLNETKTLIEKAQGQIEELSVAVILNSASGAAPYLDQVRDLVAGAIGVADERIAVQLLPFWGQTDDPDQQLGQASFQQQQQLLSVLDRGNTRRVLIWSLTAFLVVLMLVLMVRSLTRQAVYQEGPVGMPVDALPASADQAALPVLDPPAAKLDFENKDVDLVQLEEYIDKSPEAVAQLLKSWLAEE